MVSVAPPRVAVSSPQTVKIFAAGQPSPLRSAVSVAHEVLLPCARGLCSAPVRAIAYLGVALGLRQAKRRPMARKISGSATRHPKPAGRVRGNPFQAVGHHLRNAMVEFSTWLNGLAPPELQRNVAQIVALEPGALEAPQARVKPGSLYQNEYMTLWNDSNDPVSAVLKILSHDLFELTVDHLDSVNGGSCGCIIFRSGFTLSDVPNQPHKKRLQLKIRKDVEPLEYDDQLFERPARMALGFLKRASWMLAGAFEMEYDVEKNSVTAGPKTAVLKPFWQKVVELHPTPQDKLWTWEPMQKVQMEHAYAAPALVTA